MVNRFAVLLACALAFFYAASAGRAAEEPARNTAQVVNLYVGEVRSLPVTKVQRVAIGNGKVITTNVLESELLLLAEQPGRTTLVVWTIDNRQLTFDVTVTATDATDTLHRLTKLLAFVPGVQVEKIGTQIVVSGTASKPNLVRIDAITRMFPQAINVVREEEVTMKRIVFLKLSFVEMTRTVAENVGVAWQQQINGPAAGLAGDLVNNNLFRIPTTPPAGFPSALPNTIQSISAYFGITSAITSQINLAVQNNEAWLLATPELSTRSGGEAKFLAGGQVPVVTPASGLSPPTVTYKDFGVKLSIQPTADDKDNISALIKTEVSTIDPATTVAGNPGFLTRSTDSEINVRNGQTIVLSGIVNSNLSRAIQKVPWLSEIPILGALFKSTNFQNGRTDLVILVTPNVIDPTSTVNRERIEKSQELQQKFQRSLGPKGIVD